MYKLNLSKEISWLQCLKALELSHTGYWVKTLWTYIYLIKYYAIIIICVVE